MIPYLLAAIGGYLIGDSMKESQSFADGGEIRRFDRHEQMDSETRGEILDTINEFYLIDGFRSLQNYLYGLFDGYDYSQTDSFKESMSKLKAEHLALHNRIEKIYQKIDKYSFEKFADGGITKGDRVIWDGEKAYVESIDGNKVKLFINHPESHNNGKVYSRDKHFVVDIDELKGKTLSRRKSKPFKYDEFERGGKTKDMSIQFIEYKDKTIMFEPHNKEYFTNDIEFKSLADAKKYIDAGSPDPSWEKFVYSQGIMAEGGVAKGGKIKEGDMVIVKTEKLKAEVTNIGTDYITVEFVGKRPEGGDKRGTYKESQLKKIMANGGVAERELTFEIADVDAVIEEYSPIVLRVNVGFYMDKIDVFADKVYTFNLDVEDSVYDGYSIGDILYDGKKIPKEESHMLERNQYVLDEVDRAFEKVIEYHRDAEDDNYDNYYAKGGELDKVSKRKIGPFRQNVKEDAQNYSRRNKTKTYVFDYEFMRHNGQPTTSLSERFTYGTQEDLDYMKEKGFDKDFKVIATYDNGTQVIDWNAK